MNLWNKLVERTDQALVSRALAPIETEVETIEDAGVRFVVRCVSSLARKAEQVATRAKAPADTPVAFPIEADLTVARVSGTHVAVLNKFPVIPHHLLLITRDYVPQEALLDLADFDALTQCMVDYESLGFYNGGKRAGASQPHKHLQVVPLPLGAESGVPIAVLFESLPRSPGVLSVPGFPFRHAFAWVNGSSAGDVLQLYRDLLAAVGIAGIMRDGVLLQSAPYNVLLSREWMFVVPRWKEDFEDISINALGFAGSIFVKNSQELARVREAGPMALLRAVAVA
jgi:sulfate adenylyltransferase (ADP) / ATP adenylyltransferase